MRFLELRVPPVLVWISFAALIYIVARLLPALTVDLPARRAVAFLLIGFGGIIGIVGIVTFRAHKTTIHPMEPDAASSVVTTGIYRFSRNPMYLGLFFGLTGWAILVANLAALLLLPLFIAYMTAFQILPEERALFKKFGASYVQYTRTTRRWV